MTMRRLTVLLTLVLLTGTVCAAKLYRWVDADGKVHYSDKVPPEAIQGGHSQLNDRGIVVEREGAAKTPEERAREEEVERLRKEQQRLVEEQKARDEALLRTFRTEDDIILTRDGKLAAVDAQIKLLQNNINRLKRQLADQQQAAADMEKQGNPISKRLRDDIASSQRQIEDAYAAILRREREKKQITDNYGADLERFRELRNLNVDQAAPAPHDEPVVFLDTLVTCEGPEQCNQYWLKAKAYAKKHATTSLQVDSDRILMTTPPRRNDDLSMTVSRIPLDNGTGEKIFLDAQCRDTALGQEFCDSDAVAKIRAGFRPELTGK